MSIVILALAGVAVGAVVNLLADYLPRRARPDLPRCEACGRSHHPPQWIAVAAYACGRGRCAHCGAPLRLRRPIVELASALTLAYLFRRFGFTIQFGLLAALLECLLLIAVIDLEHRLILYVTIAPAAGMALLYSVFGAERDVAKVLIGGAVGFGVMYAVYLLGWAFSAAVARLRGKPPSEVAFGGGDVNLAGVVGLAVGWSGIVFALTIAVLSGGVGALIYLTVMTVRKRYSLFSAIPYGPFLIFGAVVLLLFEAEIKRWYGLGR